MGRSLVVFVSLLGIISQRPLENRQSVSLRPPQFVAISVANLEKSAQWYCPVFDLVVLKETWGSDGLSHTRVLGSEALVVELSAHTRARSLESYAGPSTPSFLLHGFFKAGLFVADLDAAIASLRTRGVTLGPVQQDAASALRWTPFRDNAGNFLQLLERSRLSP